MTVALVLLICVNVFLALAALGAMREMGLLRAEVDAWQDLVKNPPPPSFIGAEPPPALAEVLQSEWTPLPPQEVPAKELVAFLSPGCSPCEHIAESLTAAVENRDLSSKHLRFIVWTFSEPEGKALAARLPGESVLDLDGSIASACEVRGTPTLLMVSREEQRVVDFSTEGKISWVLDHLAGQAPRTALT